MHYQAAIMAPPITLFKESLKIIIDVIYNYITIVYNYIHTHSHSYIVMGKILYVYITVAFPKHTGMEYNINIDI